MHPQSNPPTRAAIYCRVSTPGQESEGTSLATQEDACRQYATEHGYIVDEACFYREVYSGIELWDRPQLSRMREAIRRRQIRAVVVYAIDRLSRDPVHLGVILSEAEHVGVGVLFVTEPLDNTPEGQLIRFVRGYAAKVEHLKITERMTRGRRARVAAGKPLLGYKPLYGYRLTPDRSRYVIDEPAAAVVRRCFADVLHGKSLREIARQLTAERLPVPSGQALAWRQTTIAKLLHHPGYSGVAYAYRYVNAKENGQKRQTVRAADDWVELPEGTIPAIVDRDGWNEAQRVLTRNKEHAGKQVRAPERYLLRGGVAICGYCGWPMHAGQNGAGRAYYYCGARKYKPGHCSEAGSILAETIDGAVWRIVADHLRHPNLIAAEVKRRMSEGPAESELASLDRALAEVARRLNNLLDSLADVSPRTDQVLHLIVREKLDIAIAQQTQLRSERQALLDQHASWRLAQIALDGIEAWCRTVASNLETLDYEGRRLALHALGVHVRIYRVNHEPRYEINPAIDLGPFMDGGTGPVSKKTA